MVNEGGKEETVENEHDHPRLFRVYGPSCQHASWRKRRVAKAKSSCGYWVSILSGGSSENPVATGEE